MPRVGAWIPGIVLSPLYQPRRMTIAARSMGWPSRIGADLDIPNLAAARLLVSRCAALPSAPTGQECGVMAQFLVFSMTMFIPWY